MGARQKLNAANLYGACFVAGLIGIAAKSWIVFGVTAAMLIAIAIHEGTIRPTGGPR